MLNQTQTQKQQIKILPHQIQLLNIYHLTSLELEERIKDELDENPLLEENNAETNNEAKKLSKDEIQDFMSREEYMYDDVPDYRTEYQNYFSQDFPTYMPLPGTIDFREDLKKQFREQYRDVSLYDMADFLIDSLTDDGLMDQDVNSLSEQISFSFHEWVEKESIEEIIQKLQQLEPPGIAARNLRECLLLKLQRLNQKRPDVKKAVHLLENYFDDLRSGHLEKIKRNLHLEDEEVKIILKLLATLHPKPIVENNDCINLKRTIVPDFIITGEKGEFHISLYRQRSSDLFISNQWAYTATEKGNQNGTSKDLQKYIRNKLSSAQWFINAIRERERNMLKIMREIVKFQFDYFEEGDIRRLKPMVLKNIAEKVGLDISSVSRITCNKYAETDFGIIALKDLFTEGIINEDGLSISNKVIKSMIKEIIESENKSNPFTDQQLMSILASRGCSVARRTVAKYREQLQISVAHRRGLWAEIM